MKLSLYIAKRYIFSKKSHNAINIISFISVAGIAIATMATICVLSILNGFSDVALKSFSGIDPDLKITTVKGKVFDPTSPEISKVKSLAEISVAAETLEDNALVKFGDRSTPALIKGVSSEYINIINPSIVIDGDFSVKEGDIEFCVIGGSLAMNLDVRPRYASPLEIFAPKRNVRVNLANPNSAFEKVNAFVAGAFITNQEKYDTQMAFISLEAAQRLFRYENEISGLEIKLKEAEKVNSVKNNIRSMLGDDYQVKDRFEQQEETFKMINIEKWVIFLILIFIVVIAVFNIIGSLSMLIIDKKQDIKILQNLGASNKLISSIFLFEGWMISFIGSLIGLISGFILCLMQQHFGLLKLGADTSGFIIDAYPVVVEPFDIVRTFITVNIIGYIAVFYPSNNLRKNLRKNLTNNSNQ